MLSPSLLGSHSDFVKVPKKVSARTGFGTQWPQVRRIKIGVWSWFTKVLTDTQREGMTRLGSPPAKGWIAQLDR